MLRLSRRPLGHLVAAGRCRQLSRRSFGTLPQPMGLYDPKNEKDSCGVGLVCNLKSDPSHEVVQDSLLMLARMSHRGGCGCDANSGDGAGAFSNPVAALVSGSPQPRATCRHTCGDAALVFCGHSAR